MNITPQMLIQATFELINNQQVMQAKINILQSTNYILCFVIFILTIALYKINKKIN